MVSALVPTVVSWDWVAWIVKWRFEISESILTMVGLSSFEVRTDLEVGTIEGMEASSALALGRSPFAGDVPLESSSRFGLELFERSLVSDPLKCCTFLCDDDVGGGFLRPARLAQVRRFLDV